jgi:hypothetical protein
LLSLFDQRLGPDDYEVIYDWHNQQLLKSDFYSQQLAKSNNNSMSKNCKYSLDLDQRWTLRVLIQQFRALVKENDSRFGKVLEIRRLRRSEVLSIGQSIGEEIFAPNFSAPTTLK